MMHNNWPKLVSRSGAEAIAHMCMACLACFILVTRVHACMGVVSAPCARRSLQAHVFWRMCSYYRPACWRGRKL